MHWKQNAQSMKKKKSNVTGAVLFAKQSGKTSFSSLWDIKNSLNTDKVGHTGTLDSFADGLLVVLTGHLTHLVPHITSFTKKYKAVVCFGKETDTLDPTGEVIKTGKTVNQEEVKNILPQFTGAVLQTPPLYSAIHVDGKRASDLARNGEEIKIEPRQIFIYKNELLDFKSAEECNDGCSYALLEIECSKGTYIRSIARDVAAKLGTCGHLIALRRTQVGPFKLEDACGYGMLNEFSIENALAKKEIFVKKEAEKSAEKHALKEKRELTPEQVKLHAEIKNNFRVMTKEFASLCGFKCLVIKKEFEKNYINGRPLQFKMFDILETEVYSTNNNKKEYAVFYEDSNFAGIISNDGKKYHYEFAVHPESAETGKITVYSWADIMNGKFNAEYIARGTALTVGSFDGMHKGHSSLLDEVLSKKNLVPGIVTFSSPFEKKAEVSTLSQKLEICTIKGINFAVVIDFSTDFAKINGKDFILILKNYCGMKFLAEGKDFNCGYQGAFDAEQIALLAKEQGFEFKTAQDELLDGKRISSSLIRDAVKNADFMNAEKMLGRPYSLDTGSLKWNVEEVEYKNPEEEIWFTAQNNSLQVIPSDANYNVNVCLSAKDGGSETLLYRTSCVFEKGIIKLLLPAGTKFSRIKAIVF